MRKGIPIKNSRLERRLKRRFEEKHNTRHLFKQKGWSNHDYYRNQNQKRKHISELDNKIVRRLIDKITVGNKYVVDGVKKQDIMICYKATPHNAANKFSQIKLIP